MSERFTRLFTAPTDLYAENSPVIISAGALLKDNNTGAVIAQLKFKSILDKEIKALKVLVHPKDIMGESLGTSIEKTYLDLSVSRDMEFGQKEAIFLPDSLARSFTAEVVSVIFADKTIWQSEGAVWERLPSPIPISANLQDKQLIKQWQIIFGLSANYVPVRHKNLWQCTCGYWNVSGVDLRCHSCAADHLKQFSYDYEKLRTAKEKRVERESEILQQRKAEEKAYFTRVKRFTVILVACLLLAAAGFALYIFRPVGDNSGVTQETSSEVKQQGASFDAKQGDSSDVTQEVTTLTALSADDITVGDLLCFGMYEQDNNSDNGKEPIEWLVLSKKNNSAMLLSRYALAWKQFQNTSSSADWVNCNLRTWLNNDFFYEAFSSVEQASVLDTVVDNSFNQLNMEWAHYIVENTVDKVYLLSYQEILSAFPRPADRKCVASASLLDKVDSRYVSEDQCCFWWLRSPGKNVIDAAYVDLTGSVDYISSLSGWVAVRPVIWVDLSNVEFSGHVKVSEIKEPYEISSFEPGISEVPLEHSTPGAGIVGFPSHSVVTTNDNISIGDLLCFGMYEQDHNPDNGSEPIEWIVLAKEDNSVMLLSRYALASRQYHDGRTKTSWKDCELRNWLNNNFFPVAFSSSEQAAVLDTVVDNRPAQNNPMWTQAACGDTVDKVYLLSYQEVMSAFSTDEARQCEPAASLRPLGYVSTGQLDKYSFWWLRSPGETTTDAAFVNLLGTVYYGSTSRVEGVRPVIWVDLGKAVFSEHIEAADIKAPIMSSSEPSTQEAAISGMPSISFSSGTTLSDNTLQNQEQSAQDNNELVDFNTGVIQDNIDQLSVALGFRLVMLNTGLGSEVVESRVQPVGQSKYVIAIAESKNGSLSQKRVAVITCENENGERVDGYEKPEIVKLDTVIYSDYPEYLLSVPTCIMSTFEGNIITDELKEAVLMMYSNVVVNNQASYETKYNGMRFVMSRNMLGNYTFEAYMDA